MRLQSNLRYWIASAIVLGLGLLPLLLLTQTNRSVPRTRTTAFTNKPLASSRRPKRRSQSRPTHASYRHLIKQGELIDTVEEKLADNTRKKVSLYSTRSRKYPITRVEEISAPQTQKSHIPSKRIISMVGDHILVRLHPHATERDLIQLTKVYGGYKRKKLRDGRTFLIAFPHADCRTVTKAIKLYSSAKHIVASAEPDVIYYSTATPDDARLSKCWALNNEGQTGGLADADIDATEAWDIATGNRNVVVGIIDSGIDYRHQDLRNNIWVNLNEIPGNGVDDDGNGYVDDVHGWDFANDDNDPMDDNGHGTHCAGIIGAEANNGIGIVGVNWAVSMMALKFLDEDGSGYSSDAIDAVQYATSMGADITSNSWGGGGYSQTLEAAIKDAEVADVLFVTAAGNAGYDLDTFAYYPADYNLSNVFVVGSSNHNDAISDFSNFGVQSVDLLAPGESIYSTLPGNSYGHRSGTSMATPMVAGTCALLKSMAPDLNHSSLKNIIMRSVDVIPDLSWRCASSGRLNAQKALGLVQNPILHIQALNITDDLAANTMGRNNGLFSPGETISIGVTLKNVGLQDLTNSTFTVTPTSATSDLTLSNAAQSLPALPAGSSQSLGDPVFVQISTEIPVPQVLRLKLTVETPTGFHWDKEISFEVSDAFELSGTVVDAETAEPVGGASITIAGPAPRTLQADANGAYQVQLPPGSYDLTASALPNYLQGSPQSLDLTSNTEVVLNVTPNHQPVASDATVSVDEDSEVVLTYGGTDQETPEYSLVPTVVKDPSHGVLSVWGGFPKKYKPNPDFSGVDTVQFTISDGYLQSEVATVTINVAPSQDAPVARADLVYLASPGDSVTIEDVMANDFDVDGDSLTLVGNTQPAQGSIVPQPNQSFMYTAGPSFTGVDSFNYTIEDGSGATATGSVRIMIGTPTMNGEWLTMGKDGTHSSSVDGFANTHLPVKAWSRTLDPNGLNQAVVARGKVFVSTASSLCALSPQNGWDVWKQTFEDELVSNPPTWYSGRIYCQRVAKTGQYSNVIALDEDSGEIDWSINGSSTYAWEPIKSPSMVVSGGTLWFAGHVSDTLTGVDPGTGSIVASYIAPNPKPNRTPSCWNERLFSYGYTFAEHDTSTGTPTWTSDLGYSYKGTVPVLAGGSVFAATASQLACLNLTTQQITWTRGGEFSTPASAYGIVVVCEAMSIKAFVAESGSRYGQADADEQLVGQPVISADTIYAASTAATYAFDASTLARKWKIPVGGMLSVADGRLYIADDNGAIHSYILCPNSNNPPSAADDTVETQEDTELIINVAANDYDPDGDSLGAMSVSAPLNGQASVCAGGQISYVPNNDFAGTDTFTYTLTDHHGGSDTGSVTVTVHAVNDAPRTVDDVVFMGLGENNVLDLLQNDTDPEGDLFAITSWTSPGSGELLQQPDQTLTYQATEVGRFQFTYTVTDEHGAFNTGTVNLIVAINGLGGDWTMYGGTEEHNSYVPGYLGERPIQLAWEREIDHKDIQSVRVAGGRVFVTPCDSRGSWYENYVQALNPETGELLWRKAIDQAHSWAPPAYSSGSLILYASDESRWGYFDLIRISAGSGEHQWTTPLPDAGYGRKGPTVFDGKIWVGSNDMLHCHSLIDGSELYSLFATPYGAQTPTIHNGKVYMYQDTSKIKQLSIDSGAIEWELPFSNFQRNTCVGIGDLIFVVSQNRVLAINTVSTSEEWQSESGYMAGLSTSDSTVFATKESEIHEYGIDGSLLNKYYLENPNSSFIDRPIVTDDVIIATTCNDSPDGTYVFDRKTGTVKHHIPQQGRIVLSNDRLFISTNQGSLYCYRISPNTNVPPVAVDDYETTSEDSALEIDVIVNDTDPEGDSLTVVSTTPAQHGAAVVDNNRVTYTPNANYHGSDSFTYTISDSHGNSSTATVYINVASVEDAPIAQDDSIVVQRNVAREISLKATDSDGDLLTYTVVTSPAHGTISGTPPNLLYTPTTDYHGPDQLVWRVNDGQTDSPDATIQIKVNAPPIASFTVEAGSGATPFMVSADATSSSDPDGDELSYRWQFGDGASAQGLPNATHTYYFSGTYTVKLEVQDGNGGTATQTMNVSSVGDIDRIGPFEVAIGEIPIDGDNSSAWQRLQVSSDGNTIALVKDKLFLMDTNTLAFKQYDVGATEALTSACFSHDGSTVYVSVYNENAIYAIQASTGSVARKYNLPASPRTMHRWDANRLMVAFDYSSVGLLSLADGSVEFLRKDTASSLQEIQVHPSTNDVYMGGTETTPHSFAQFRYQAPDYLRFQDRWGSFSGFLNQMVLGSNGQKMYLASGAEHSILEVDLTVPSNGTRGTIREFPTGQWPSSVAIDEENRNLYCHGAIENEARIYNLDTLELTSTLSLQVYGNAIMDDVAVGSFAAANGSCFGVFRYGVNTGQGYDMRWGVFRFPAEANSSPSIQSLVATPTVAVYPESVALSVTATDPDGDPLSYAWSKISGPGRVTFAPVAIASTEASFEMPGLYTLSANVSDGRTVVSSEATILIEATNRAPSANPDSASTHRNQPVSIDVLQNDSDINGDAFEIVSWSTPSHGTVEQLGDQLRYSPASDYVGADVFTYTLRDVHGGEATGHVVVLVETGGLTGNWPMMAANPAHTGYYPGVSGNKPLVHKWTATVGTSELHQPIIAEGKVYLTQANLWGQHDFSCLDEQTGQVLWSNWYINRYPYSHSQPVWQDSKIYFIYGNGKPSQSNLANRTDLICISAADGTEDWTTSLDEYIQPFYAPVPTANSILIGSMQVPHGLNVVDLATHALEPMVNAVHGATQWAPSIREDLAYSWSNGMFTVSNHLTKQEVWKLELEPYIYGTVIMDSVTAVTEDSAYVTSSSALYAIDLTNRTLRWSYRGSITKSAAVAGNNIYAIVGSVVKCFDTLNGRLIREFPTTADALTQEPIITDDMLIVTSATESYVFDRWTGQLKHQLPVGGKIAIANDCLFISCSNGQTHAYEFETERSPVITANATASPDELTLPATTTVTITANDPDGDALTYAWSKVSGPGVVMFTPANAATSEASFTAPGTYVLRVEVSDGSATVSSDVTVTVLAPLQAESGMISMVGSDAWKTVNLRKSYSSPVVVCTPNYSKEQVPLVPRVRAVTGNSFELKLDRADGQTGAVTGVNVHFLVVEEGVYTAAEHGITMEAATYTSTATASNTSWVGEVKSYANTYTTPVVVGQVMSANDPRFSVFWSCGTARNNPADATTLRVGKHTAEDTVKTRADEVVGYIVIEQGSGTIDGINYTAGVGGDSVSGMGNSPAYNYAISGFSSATAVASSAGMDGSDGGWPVLYGDTPTSTQLGLAIDEDQFKDSERGHTTEQVAYIVLENTSPVADAGIDQEVEDADSSGSEMVTLDGSASTDSDGTITSYVWSEGGSQIATGATPTVELTVGVHNITLTVTNNYGLSGTDTVTVTLTSGAVGSSQPGLFYGTVAGNINTTDPNPKTAVTVSLSETEDGIASNTTEIYTGEIFDADGHISFTEDIDDKTRLYIDGVLVLSSNKWNDRISTADLNLTPGWHTFELRISNGSGGSGPHTAPGFGYDPDGGTNWVHPADPGDGSLFRTAPPQSAFTTSEDIGGPGLTGSSSHDEGVYTVIGGGNDIWGTADKFHFVHKTVSGDAEVIVRVNSVQNTNQWAKAGIMMRSGTAANAPFAMVIQRPDKRACFQWRTAAGSEAAWNRTLMGDTTNAKWLKLKREGDAFTAYYSVDGNTWTQISTARTVVLPADVELGLCVTSHDDTKLSTAVFDNLSITNQ